MKKFSFVKNQKIFFGIVILMVIVGIASFCLRGFNLDIDFVGGTEVSYDIGQTVTKEDEAAIADLVKEVIGAENFSSVRVSGDTADAVTIRTKVLDNDDHTEEISAAIEAKMTELYPDAVLSEESDETYKVYTKPADEEEAEADTEETPAWTDEDAAAVEEALAELGAADLSVNASGDSLYISFESSSVIGKLRSDITTAITEKYENAAWRSTNTVSAEVSAGLKSSAITATILAVILMLIYIAFRFQISSAFAAILCLAHDLFIVIVSYSLFQIPVNSNIIAALLTILGYSINATIIIFDRIRENNAKMSSSVPFADKVDDGIRATFTRSLNTTLTTLFTIGMVYILGVESIKNFALPLIVGIIAGLFSSVCLAGPTWNALKKVKLGKK